MSQPTEADRYLLEQVRKGDPAGWAQCVERYQGRLLALARSRVRQQATAEDLVQETFLAFLQGVGRFQVRSTLETWLFTILRRKIIDLYRRPEMRPGFLHELTPGDSGELALPAREQTASWYARRNEQHERLEAALADALEAMLRRLRTAEKLRDLQVVEMLFYAQLRNRDIARLSGLDEKHVALIKHRTLKEIRQHLAASEGSVARVEGAGWGLAHHRAPSSGGASPALHPSSDHSLLTAVWQRHRLTCPKRSTIGRYLLGTLEAPWRDFVQFHLEQIQCPFCRANRDDLARSEAETSRRFQAQLFESTIGFLTRP